MLNNRWIEFWVGILVLLALLGLGFMALNVSGLNMSSFSAKYYNITENFGSVQNLKPRSPIRIAGVQVGDVTSISLNPKTLQAHVSMRILQSFNHIPINSKGAVKSSSLLGDNYIQIFPGSSKYYLKNGSELPYSPTPSVSLMSTLSSLLNGSDLNPQLLGNSYYLITEQFPSVGSLNIGAPVKISGVKIGRVSKIYLDPKNLTATVSMRIQKNYNHIPLDSQGQIASVSLLGGAYINIIPGIMPMVLKPNMSLEKMGIGPTNLSNLLSTFMSSNSNKSSSNKPK